MKINKKIVLAALVLTLTGNIGKFGTGCHTWSGNYKAGIWNATPWSGAGLAVHTGEDPFNQTLDANARKSPLLELRYEVFGKCRDMPGGAAGRDDKGVA